MNSATSINSPSLGAGWKPSQGPPGPDMVLDAPRRHWWPVPGLGAALSSAGMAMAQGWVQGQPSCTHSDSFSPWLPSRQWA